MFFSLNTFSPVGYMFACFFRFIYNLIIDLSI